MTSWIGLDIGGTHIKCADLYADRIDAIQTAPFPELDSDHQVPLRRVLDVCRDLIEGRHGKELWISAQMGCSVYGGTVISWQNRRVEQEHLPGAPDLSWWESIQSRLKESPNFVVECGNELRPGAPICHAYRLRELGVLRDWSEMPVSLGDAVAAGLLRSDAGYTDATNASATGAFNVLKGELHQSMLQALGLMKLYTPVIVKTGFLLGHLPTGPAVRLPVGDQQAALMGARLGYKRVSINLGTGAQVSMRAVTPQTGNYFQTRPYPSCGWLVTKTHLLGGLRAATMEQRVDNYAAAFSLLPEDVRKHAEDIVFTGGFAKANPGLCAATADRLQLPWLYHTEYEGFETLAGLRDLAVKYS